MNKTRRHKLTCKEKLLISLSILGLSCIFTEECDFSKLTEHHDKVRPTQYTEQLALAQDYKCLDGVCML